MYMAQGCDERRETNYKYMIIKVIPTDCKDDRDIRFSVQNYTFMTIKRTIRLNKTILFISISKLTKIFLYSFVLHLFLYHLNFISLLNRLYNQQLLLSLYLKPNLQITYCVVSDSAVNRSGCRHRK